MFYTNLNANLNENRVHIFAFLFQNWYFCVNLNENRVHIFNFSLKKIACSGKLSIMMDRCTTSKNSSEGPSVGIWTKVQRPNRNVKYHHWQKVQSILTESVDLVVC